MLRLRTSNHIYGAERLGVDQVLDSVWTVMDTVVNQQFGRVFDQFCNCMKKWYYDGKADFYRQITPNTMWGVQTDN
jgi:hypothetical protein